MSFFKKNNTQYEPVAFNENFAEVKQNIIETQRVHKQQPNHQSQEVKVQKAPIAMDQLCSAFG